MHEKYPPDWLCVTCNRPFFKHVQIGDKNEEASSPIAASQNWCFSKFDNYYNKENHVAWRFKPVDNLTQIEQLAQQKNLMK